MKKESYTDEEIIKGIQRQDNDVVVFVYLLSIISKKTAVTAWMLKTFFKRLCSYSTAKLLTVR